MGPSYSPWHAELSLVVSLHTAFTLVNCPLIKLPSNCSILFPNEAQTYNIDFTYGLTQQLK